MSHKKYISSLLAITLVGSLSFTYADDLSDAKTSVTQSVSALIERYEARIKALEQENASLKSQIATLKASTTVTPSASNMSTPVIVSTGGTSIAGLSKDATRTQVMNRINALLPSIISEHGLDASGAIGLFEFVEPNSVFISIDDGKNPAGVTAFKTKILYSYDDALNLTKTGLFDLDYKSGYYITKYGSNPFAKATRTRIQNPSYKGKLFDVVTATATGSTPPSSNTSSVTAPASDVTFAQIKAAYDKNKLLDALKLSDSYIAKNPNDLDTLKIRYRSYYIVGKYDDSLAEIKKIETVSGTAFDRAIACDAAVIAKIAKKTDVSTYYSGICKKK